MQTTKLIIKEDCYSPIKIKANTLPLYLKSLIDLELKWQEHFGFECIEIDKIWIQQEPALKAINSIHKIFRLGLLKIQAESMYDWHVDSIRQSCLNMLISENHNSITLFGSQRDYVNKDILQLQYQPNTYYLFNNQIEHCVINIDVTRYLFSLYFEQEISYSKLKAMLQKHNVVD